MGFLSTASSSGSSSSEVAQAAFNYIYESIAVDVHQSGERFLELGHFDLLATTTHLSLDDLSLYVLAFAADEGSRQILKISEKHLVTWMAKIASGLPRNATPPTKANGFAALFDAVHDAVIQVNGGIHKDKAKLANFYQFLYNWCLKGNKSKDLVDTAKELWLSFFSATPVSYTPDQTLHQFTAYVCFPRINQWVEFITLLNSPAVLKKQHRDVTEPVGVSLDVWTQLLLFSKLPNYDTYNCQDSWPVALDDFVEYVLKMEKEQNVAEVVSGGGGRN